MTSVGPGTILAGKYRVTKVLGEGGMGIVVAAVHLQLDEPVALKFMLPSALESSEATARFLREARASAKLKSEHVARVSDVGTLETGAPYIVMEYLQGTDLADLLAAKGPLSPEEAVDYVVQACDALAEAHSLGIVHRDLKPANLFLTHRRDGSALVKVLDFGISKSSPLNDVSGDNLTKTGGLMGSPHYMSPEQMKSAKHTDARTDIWSLGVILYELVGGRRPFKAETLGGLMAQVLTETPEPLGAVRAGLPVPLYTAVAKCLAKDREKRWGSVAELALALAPVAPPRVHPLIERIAGQAGGASAESGGPRRSSTPSFAAVRAGQVPTTPGWSDTAGTPSTGSMKKGMAIAATAVIALATVATVIVRRGPPASAHVATSDAAPMVSVATSPAPDEARIDPSPVVPSPVPTLEMVKAVAEVPTSAKDAGSATIRETPKPTVTTTAGVTKKAAVHLGAATSASAAPVKPPADLLDTSN